MTRNPFVSGQFYPNNPEELKETIVRSFKSELGPGYLPTSQRSKDIIGIISPHAGYMFSGPAASWAYKEIAESKFPDLYVLVGLSHNGFPSSISLEDWETPLGILKNDNIFGRVFMANSGLKPKENENASEHSIEVQLPFLQFASQDLLDKLRIFPITISNDRNPLDIANSILKTSEQSRKKIILIASSDFTHFGINYGYFPFSTDIKENMYRLDEGAIRFISRLDPIGFNDYITETGATICGKKPIETLIHYSRLVNAKKAAMLKYYTSGDIIGDYSSAVGYSSIVIR